MSNNFTGDIYISTNHLHNINGILLLPLLWLLLLSLFVGCCCLNCCCWCCFKALPKSSIVQTDLTILNYDNFWYIMIMHMNGKSERLFNFSFFLLSFTDSLFFKTNKSKCMMWTEKVCTELKVFSRTELLSLPDSLLLRLQQCRMYKN